jgi:hypothetical protein
MNYFAARLEIHLMHELNESFHQQIVCQPRFPAFIKIVIDFYPTLISRGTDVL